MNKTQPTTSSGNAKWIIFTVVLAAVLIGAETISILSTGIGRGQKTLVIPRPAEEGFFMSDLQTCNERSWMCRANVLMKHFDDAYFTVGFHLPFAVTLAGSKN